MADEPRVRVRTRVRVKPRVRKRRRVPPAPEAGEGEKPASVAKPRTRAPRRNVTTDKTDKQLAGGIFDPFANGGPVHAEYLCVGITGTRKTAGYVVPSEDGTRRAAYLQNPDGTREFLGWHGKSLDAVKAITGAAKKPRTRAV